MTHRRTSRQFREGGRGRGRNRRHLRGRRLAKSAIAAMRVRADFSLGQIAPEWVRCAFTNLAARFDACCRRRRVALWAVLATNVQAHFLWRPATGAMTNGRTSRNCREGCDRRGRSSRCGFARFMNAPRLVLAIGCRSPQATSNHLDTHPIDHSWGTATVLFWGCVVFRTCWRLFPSASFLGFSMSARASEFATRMRPSAEVTCCCIGPRHVEAIRAWLETLERSPWFLLGKTLGKLAAHKLGYQWFVIVSDGI